MSGYFEAGFSITLICAVCGERIHSEVPDEFLKVSGSDLLVKVPSCPECLKSFRRMQMVLADAVKANETV